MKLITLSLFYDGSKAYVNPKNICAIYRNSHGVTELRFAGGDGGNYVMVKESVETVAKMIERNEGFMCFTTAT